jgi:hypothetical protein
MKAEKRLLLNSVEGKLKKQTEGRSRSNKREGK